MVQKDEKQTMSFQDRCLKLVDTIPKGRVTTYKALAHALQTKAYRAIGNALNKNPNLFTTPCHRVIKSDGSLGGYAKGVDRKRELLKSEGVQIDKKGKIVEFEKILFKPYIT